jgi:small-conductance mechanosensitive channel
MKTLVAGMRSTGNRLVASLVVAVVCHGIWAADACATPKASAKLLTAGNSPAAQQPAPPATLRLANREIVVLRTTFQGLTPEERVDRVRERVRKFTPETIAEPIRALPITVAESKGVQFVIGDALLFPVLEGDVDPETRQTFDALVKQTQARLEEVRTAWLHSRDEPLLIRGFLKALAATVLLGLLLWLAHHYSGRLVAWMEKWRDKIAAVHAYVDLREFLARALVGSLQIVRAIILFALAYAWLIYVLGCFDYTAPIADVLGDWLWDRVLWLGDSVLGGLPGLITVLIVLAFTRLVVDAVRYFFDAVQRGRLRLPMFHPDTTSATRRIVTLVVWGLGIAAAYPYLPGANTDAFKGLSVLFGLMITLGSAGLVTQAMSGLVIIYSRALQKGDFVDINGVQGVVSEVASLATKVINVRNEEITVPNSVVIASPIRNYSKLAGSQGTLITTKVTIGYDAPWRQVHALLIAAANKTTGVRATPTPYVYQLALSDFYVEYELFASIDRPIERVPVLSLLHANIQDAFNEAGVQIMSPHFLAQPDEDVVVSRSRWYAPPAQPPVEGQA